MPDPETIEKIIAITGNEHLAVDLCEAIEAALKNPVVFVCGERSAWGVFERALHEAIRDIQEHPRGKLFQRLIKYGPIGPDHVESPTHDKNTYLSDLECETCVEFIFSHMVNRFKGELAELLALKPCILLIQELIKDGRLPGDVQLYWGNMVQERRAGRNQAESDVWAGFTKGADGIIVKRGAKIGANTTLSVRGIIEIKSMQVSQRKLLKQIHHHSDRLNGGLRLGNEEYSGTDIDIPIADLIKIMVIPSAWKLSREWRFEDCQDGSKSMVFTESRPPSESKVKEIDSNTWKISLAWSQEALNQAAYEMTYWYMSQVGERVFIESDLPKGWEDKTPGEAGFNSIKMMLYYMCLRPLSARQMRLATRLYNVYSFGYPLGVNHTRMMWPEDLEGR